MQRGRRHGLAMDLLLWHIGVYLIMFVIVLFTGAFCQAEKIIPRNSFCFQEVVVVKDGRVRSFCREGVRRYGAWYEQTPIPWGEVKKFYGRKSWVVPQDEVREAMAPAVYDLFQRRDEVIVSGYYNLSGDKRYDWTQFGGDRYGTFSRRPFQTE